MNLRAVKTHGPPAELPLLGKDDYTLLWISGFWDGPKSGMLLHEGRELWFEMFQENDDDDSLDKWYRRYAVVVLTAEQLAKERGVDADFRRYVGSAGDRRPVEEHHLFYDKHLQHCRSRSYDGNEVIAWFEL